MTHEITLVFHTIFLLIWHCSVNMHENIFNTTLPVYVEARCADVTRRPADGRNPKAPFEGGDTACGEADTRQASVEVAGVLAVLGKSPQWITA